MTGDSCSSPSKDLQQTSCEERFLPGNNSDPGHGWREEALAVFADINGLVHLVSISDTLPCNESGIYFNLETKERSKFTVELSTAGFRICAHEFDSIQDVNTKYFETIYALLDNISPLYRDSFSKSLAEKLDDLTNRDQDQDQ